MEITKNNTLPTLCYAALFFCALYLFVATCNIVEGISGLNLIPGIKWIQSAVFYGKHLLCIALVGLVSSIIINTLKGIKADNPFPKKNISLIFAVAVVDTLMNLCSANWHVMNGERYFEIDGDVLITPIMIMIFGILYSIAHGASVDSKPTI